MPSHKARVTQMAVPAWEELLLPSESLGKELLLPFPLPTYKHTQTPFSFPWVCCGHLREM